MNCVYSSQKIRAITLRQMMMVTRQEEEEEEEVEVEDPHRLLFLRRICQ